MNLTAPVEHRWSESDFGERRADLVVAPPLGFKFDPPTRALRRGVPLSESGIGLIIENLSRNAIDAEVEIVAADASERRVGGKTIQLEAGERDRWRIEFDGADDNVGAFVAQWRYRVGRDHSWKPAYELQTIDYRHIRPRQIARPARLDVHEMNVTIPDGLRIGYVDAAGDGVGLVLEQLGVNVMWLDASALAAGEFGEFNAVLIASRAYEARPDLVEHNDRLLDYVRAGGNLVVQYQKYPVADLGVVPFEFAYARPHERVTVETARVRLLAPGHAALSWPHRIGAADFDGWVQERGLYFWSEWDERLTPLLEMSDPGEAPMRGALLHGRLGEGHYIYTGLAFFRQLPAGVEGAARLMVNLLSVGRDRGSRKGN
jgi:hypothetical protein